MCHQRFNHGTLPSLDGVSERRAGGVIYITDAMSQKHKNELFVTADEGSSEHRDSLGIFGVRPRTVLEEQLCDGQPGVAASQPQWSAAVVAGRLDGSTGVNQRGDNIRKSTLGRTTHRRALCVRIEVAVIDIGVATIDQCLYSLIVAIGPGNRNQGFHDAKAALHRRIMHGCSTMLVLGNHTSLPADEFQSCLALAVGACSQQWRVVPHPQPFKITPLTHQFIHEGYVALLRSLHQRWLRPPCLRRLWRWLHDRGQQGLRGGERVIGLGCPRGGGLHDRGRSRGR
mmetsp:Transcript_57560/g.146129  ORF Transcript_57560/g.146129 Transcript_57560/m.146129 type:complete len:285 (-) Transcript_57560:224-1078(-)